MLSSALQSSARPLPPELISRAVLAFRNLFRLFIVRQLTIFPLSSKYLHLIFGIMVRLTVTFVFSALACTVAAAPLNKRIAQVIADSTAKWEAACLAAGGGEKCNPISVTAFTTLLAAAGPCEQQDSADAMIDLAKTLNNDPDMIKFTQIFVQQPRNSVRVVTLVESNI